MARTPVVPEADLQRMLTVITEQGYDPSQVRPVPQRWPQQFPEETGTP
jgi:lipocalin